MRRIVITGIGVVSAIGNDSRSFWRSLSEGCSGIDTIAKADISDLRFKNAAEVRGFNASEHFTDKELMWLDPFSHYGIVAAREAIADAGLEFSDNLRERTGVITGSCLGGKETEDRLFYDLYGQKKNRFPPIVIPAAMGNAVASHVSMEYGITGATFTTSTACSSANHAIGLAMWMIRQGTLDAAITGGSEAPLSYGSLKAWESMRVVSTDTCRPFSRDRSGLILGEGGSMFVIEEMESAMRRGARIYAEVAGFGMSADAHHLTMPLAEGASRAMKSALDDAQISIDEIGYINAHGTATQANDAMESNAIRMVFGDLADEIYVSSTKSMHGHALGAAGAIEAAATVFGLYNNLLPPTANFNEKDPECAVNLIKNEAISASPKAALSNSFAFGGLNAVLAFRRFDG